MARKRFLNAKDTSGSALAVTLSDLGRVLRLLRQSSPTLTLVGGVLTLLEVSLGIGALYAIKLLIDVLSDNLLGEGDGVSWAAVGPYVALAGVAVLAGVVIQSLNALAQSAQSMRVAERVDFMIHRQAVTVDLAFYESPQYFDTLERARAGGLQRPAQVINSILLILKSAVFLVAILIMLFAIEWRILPALLLSIAAILVVRLRYTRLLFEHQKKRAQKERRATYFDWLMTSNMHAKELRIGGLGEFFRNAYSLLRQEINAERLEIEKRKTRAEALVYGLGALVFAGTTALLVVEVDAGRLSIGDIALFILLFRRAEMSGREFVTNASKLTDDRLFIRQLFRFLDLRPRLLCPAAPAPLPTAERSELQFENVSFTYPDSKLEALMSIDLRLQTGKIVAIVGENGSGKTTLLKLMTRLYDPDKGRITLDGVNICDLDVDAYRRQFSIIFQDYSKYAATLRENITYGDIRLPVNDALVRRAAALGGVDDFLGGLRNGLDTPLHRVFDGGQEISIGQWQRVALARAFYPRSRFVVMDEPTSALDARAEAEIFEDFRDRLEGRGALVVSHRLSTIRMADQIYVLAGGRITEHGTHDELMKQAGTYAGLFETQGRHYRD